jgi:diacylglycerol kinase (ATP)
MQKPTGLQALPSIIFIEVLLRRNKEKGPGLPQLKAGSSSLSCSSQMSITPPFNSRNVAIVVNPHAGKGKALKLSVAITSILSTEKITFTIFNDQYPDTFNHFTEVWIIGGDGTLNLFLNKYPSISIPLAIFKGGTGNDFAWKLYGDKSFEEQMLIVIKGIARPVDGGICNNKLFVNGVGIGFDGEVVKSMGTRRFLSGGHLSYLIVVLKKIFFYREKKLLVTINEKRVEQKIFMINIANGSRYGGGFMVAPQAIIDDGQLDIIIVKPVAPLKRFFHLPRIEKGKHLSLAFVEVSKADKINVQSQQTIAAHFDGELLEANNFNVEILPGRFRFIY